MDYLYTYLSTFQSLLLGSCYVLGDRTELVDWLQVHSALGNQVSFGFLWPAICGSLRNPDHGVAWRNGW